MIKQLIAVFLLAVCATGCGTSTTKNEPNVISNRYIHRFGYDLAENDWQSNKYPGKVITTFRSGVILTTGYEDGAKHGLTTKTYPHSQTLELKEEYKRGSLKKRTQYDIRGIPTKEEDFSTPNTVLISTWFYSGSPKSKEKIVNGTLVQGEYYNTDNQLESRVSDGAGTITNRNTDGALLERYVVADSNIVQKETFHPNGNPSVTEHFMNNELHGLRSKHTPHGDPILQEYWTSGHLDGLCTYFQNGHRYLELPYSMGKKEGTEKHYIDGKTLVEESNFHNDIRHGPTMVYYDGITSTTWYYNGEQVSKDKFQQLCQREEEISKLANRAKKSVDV